MAQYTYFEGFPPIVSKKLNLDCILGTGGKYLVKIVKGLLGQARIYKSQCVFFQLTFQAKL